MTRDDFEALWRADDVDDDTPPMNSCLLIVLVLVLVWASIALGVWAVMAR